MKDWQDKMVELGIDRSGETQKRMIVEDDRISRSDEDVVEVAWNHINFSFFFLLSLFIGFLHIIAGSFFKSSFIFVREF